MASDQVPNFKMARSTRFPHSGGCEKFDRSGHGYFGLVGIVNSDAILFDTFLTTLTKM
jgi:hypothetical protein